MPKTRIRPHSGVTKKDEDGGNAYVHDFYLDGGSLVPLPLPELQQVEIPDGTKCIWSFRGKWHFSAARRSYAGKFGSIEEIYYSEVGGRARKIIAGSETQLGLNRPQFAPSVTATESFAPGSIESELVDNAGTSVVGRVRSVRFAYRSNGTILPASSTHQATITATNQGIKWTWQNPSMGGVLIEKIVVFVGDSIGQERLEAELSPAATTWLDTLASSNSGDPATNYDQKSNLKYAYTLERSIGGVIDESGPSPLSAIVKSKGTNTVTFSRDGESIGEEFDWLGLPGWSSLADADVEHPFEITNVELDTTLDRWFITFAEDHNFSDGETLIFDWDDNPFPDFIQVYQHADADKVWIDVEPDDVPIVSGNPTMMRSVQSEISLVEYDPAIAKIKLTLLDPHACSTGDTVDLIGFSDLAWETAEVYVDPENNMAIWLISKTLYSGSISPDGIFIRRRFSLMQLESGLPSTNAPTVGTTLYFTLAGVASAGTVLGIFNNTLIAITGVYLGEYTFAPGDTVTYVPNNGHITHRLLYRIGAGGDSASGTTELRLVARVPYMESEYIDASPDSEVGELIPTYYQSPAGYVVYDAPPLGITLLTMHQDIVFAVTGHNLIWSDKGKPDAFASVFSHSFSSKPLALKSYAGALIVFCQDRLYRVDGVDPSMLSIHPTRTTEGCVGGAAVEANGRLYYMAARGLMVFDGEDATCVTDKAIPPQFWRQTNIYMDTDDNSYSFLIPALKSQGYQALLENPVDSVPGLGVSTEAFTVGDLRAFAWDGRVVVYWSNVDKFQASGAVIIDTTIAKPPITFSSVRILDAHVDELERPYILIGHNPIPNGLYFVPEEYIWDTVEFCEDDTLTFYSSARRPSGNLLESVPSAIGINIRRSIRCFIYSAAFTGNSPIEVEGAWTIPAAIEPYFYSTSLYESAGKTYLAPNPVFEISNTRANGDPTEDMPVGTYDISLALRVVGSDVAWTEKLRVIICPFYELTASVIEDSLTDSLGMKRHVVVRLTVVASPDPIVITVPGIVCAFESSIVITEVDDSTVDVAFDCYENIGWDMEVWVEHAECYNSLMNRNNATVIPALSAMRESKSIHRVNEYNGAITLQHRMASYIKGETNASTIVPYGDTFVAVGGVDFLHYITEGYPENQGLPLDLVQESASRESESYSFPAYPGSQTEYTRRGAGLDTLWLGKQHVYNTENAQEGVELPIPEEHPFITDIRTVNLQTMSFDVIGDIGVNLVWPMVWHDTDNDLIRAASGLSDSLNPGPLGVASNGPTAMNPAAFSYHIRDIFFNFNPLEPDVWISRELNGRGRIFEPSPSDGGWVAAVVPTGYDYIDVAGVVSRLTGQEGVTIFNMQDKIDAWFSSLPEGQSSGSFCGIVQGLYGLDGSLIV